MRCLKIIIGYWPYQAADQFQDSIDPDATLPLPSPSLLSKIINEFPKIILKILVRYFYIPYESAGLEFDFFMPHEM